MRPADFWPTPEQELLLTAALADGDAAVRSWREWQSRMSLDGADRGSLRLMPLIYSNLRRIGSNEPSMATLKQHYLKTRIAGRELLRHLARLLLLFESEGIPTLVLKGAALGPLVYRDPGLRPMADLDIAVPHSHASQAVTLLLQNDWSLEKIPLRMQIRPASRASLQFSSPGGASCDLHFSPFPESLTWQAVTPFWSAAVPFAIEGANTLTLPATDHLLHTLAHGARANTVSPIRWIADAVWLLRGDAPILWDRFAAQARALRLSLVAARTLAYLRDRHGAAVPPDILAALRERPSLLESLEFAVRRGTFPHAAPLLWAWGRYVRQNGARNLPALLGGFPFYLQDQWSARNLPETAWIALKKLPFLPR